jgi:hypothetical protein
MRRRNFITLLGGAAAVWPVAARAQDRVRRISVINVIAATDPGASPRIAAFEAALRKLGWSKTHDLQIDYHWDVKDIADARVLARQVMASKPELLVTLTAPTQAFRDEAGAMCSIAARRRRCGTSCRSMPKTGSPASSARPRRRGDRIACLMVILPPRCTILSAGSMGGTGQ